MWDEHVHRIETSDETEDRLNLTAEQLLRFWPLAAAAHTCGIALLASVLGYRHLIIFVWALAALLEGGRVGIAQRQTRVPAANPGRRLWQLWLVLLCETALILCVLLLWSAENDPNLQAGITLFTLVLLIYLSCTTGLELRALTLCGTPIAAVTALSCLARADLQGVAYALAMATGYALSIASLKEQDRQFRIQRAALRREQALRGELEHAHKEAEVAARSKSRFLAAASHDLRQPLHALAVNATTLQLVASRLDDPLVKKLSDSINSSLAHGDHLLDSLLDISRMDAHALPPQVASVNTGGLIHSLQAEFSPLAQRQGIQFICHPGQGSMVRTDGEMLTRILRNLISNALKFTPLGGRVEVESRNIGSEVILLVRDDGPGIPFEMKERIFEEFFQLDNPARDRSKGLGLGLSIVKRLSALLQIEVQVDSVPGRGTCFSVRLPSSSSARPSEAKSRETASDRDDAALLRRHRVLAVDDEPDTLKSLHLLLSEIGVMVQGASDLAGARRLVDDGFQPTLLILDFRLGENNGLEVLTYLRRRLGELPALLLSGDTVNIQLRDCVDAITFVEHKPLSGQRLLSAIAQVAISGARELRT